MAENNDKPVSVESKKTRALGAFDEMERLFDNFLNRGNWPRWPTSWQDLEGTITKAMPKVDVVDNDSEVIVRAEVPGLRKDQIEVTVTDDAITLRGEFNKELENKEAQYYRREMSRGSFARTLALPAMVNGNQAKAKLHDGILELILPKIEKATRRTIEIE